MSRPHATLVVGAVQPVITRLLDEIVDASGYESEWHEISSLAPSLRAEMLELAKKTPLFILVGGESDKAANLKELVEGVDTSFTILVCQTSAAVREESRNLRVIRYDQENLQDFAVALMRALEEARQEFLMHPLVYLPLEMRTTEASGPYQGLTLTKEVTVLPDGHGIVDFVYEILVLSDAFESISHYVGLTDLSDPETVVPSLEHLLNRPYPERYLGQSFAFRLLYPSSSSTSMNFVEIPSESTERTRVFRFVFQPRPAKGHIIRYGMSWSHPHMYATSGPDDSLLKCLHDYSKVNLRFTFCDRSSKPKSIFQEDGEPVLTIRNPLQVKTGHLQSRPRPSLHGVGFDWELSGVSSHTTLLVEWTRR